MISFSLRRWLGLAAAALALSFALRSAVAADPAVTELQRGVQIVPASPTSWQLSWHAVAGAEYQVQRSADLQTWTDLAGGRILATGASANFTDTPPAPVGRALFWRVQLLGTLDVTPPIVTNVEARIVALPGGGRALELAVNATDDRAVVGVVVLDGNVPLGDAARDSSDGLWKLTTAVPTDSLAARVIAAIARDAAANPSARFERRFALFDPARFAPLDAQGVARRGFVVAVSPGGDLAPFEYRAGGGGTQGVGGDFVVKFPSGAKLVAGAAGSEIEFTSATAQFGARSPLQLRTPLQRTTGAAVRLPLGVLDVAALRSAFGVTGEPGLEVLVHGRTRLRWLEGKLTAAGIADPVFAPAADLGWPLPAQTARYAGFVLDWSQSNVRLPFSGEFPLGPASDAPTLRVSSANPLWLDLRGDGVIALRGNARLLLPGGGSVAVEVVADDPLYHLRVRAEGLEIPLADDLADLIPDNPQNSLPPDSGNSTIRDVALDTYAAGLAAQRRGIVQFSAAASALDPRVPAAGATAPVLPADEVGTVGSLLEAWLDLGPGAAVPADAVAELRNFSERVQQAVGYSRDAGSAARLASALGRLRTVLNGASAAGLPALRDQIAAQLPALFEAVRLRAADPQMLVDLPALESATADLLFAARAAEDAGLPAEATKLRDATRAMVARYAEDFARQLGVVAGVWTPNATVQSMTPARIEELLNRLLRLNSVVLDENDPAESLGTLWEIGTAPLAETGTQLAVGLARKIDAAITAAESAGDIEAYLESVAVKAKVVAERQLSHLPEVPAAETALDAAGLTLPAIEALVGARGLAVLAKDQAKPVEERSWADTGRALTRWAEVFAQATPSLTFAGDVLATSHAAFQRQTDTALGQLAIFGDAAGLGQLIRAGTLDARLMRQFPSKLTATLAWEDATRLPAAVTRLRQIATANRDHRELLRAAQVLLDEAATIENEAELPAMGEVDRLLRQQTRRRYLEQAALVLDSLRDVVRTAWNDTKTARAGEAGLTTDLLLPGNVQIREVRGAFTFHRITGAFRGSLGGVADLPGFFQGSRLEVINASFTSGGAYSLTVAGTITGVPMGPLTGTLSLPSRRPLLVEATPGRPLRVQGTALVQLSNGVFFEALVSLQDPVYTFGLTAGGARFELARKLSGYTTSINLSRPLAELGQATLRALADHQRNLGAAFDPLLTLASTPVTVPPLGRPPEFAVPTIDFDGASLQAWAAGLKADLGLATQAGYKEITTDLVAALQRAKADADREPPGLLSNLSLYLQTLRRAEELRRYAALGQRAIANLPANESADASAALTPALSAMRTQIEALLAQPGAVTDPALAARVAGLALDVEAEFQQAGVASPGFQNAVAPYLRTTVGGLLVTLGFDATTGQLTDTAKFAALDLAQLRAASRQLMDIQVRLQLTGDDLLAPETADNPAARKRTTPPANPYATATATVLRTYRERLVQAYQAAAPDDYALRRQLAGELTNWIAFTGLGLSGLTGLTPVSGGAALTDDPAALASDLAAQSLALQLAQSADARARADNPLYPLLLEWRRLGAPGFSTEVLANVEAELRRAFDALVPSLLAVLPADAVGLPSAAGLFKQLLEIAEAADRFNFQTFLNGVVIPQIPSFTVKFQAVADAQKAWWETSTYAGLLLDAHARRAADLNAAYSNAIEAALRSTLQTGQTIAQRLAELRPDEVRQNFDLELPGDVIVRRIGGEFTFNRVTHAFLAKFGGELEFPEFKSAGRPLLIAGEGTLDSAGHLGLAFSAHDLRLNGDEVRLDLSGALALNTTGGLTVGAGSGATTLYVRNHQPGATPEFYTYTGSIDYTAGTAGVPGRLAIRGSGTQPLTFDPNFAVFSPSVALEFTGADDGRLAVGGDLAFWATGDDRAPAGPSFSDYQLVIAGGATEFAYDATGFALSLRRADTATALRLILAPDLFGKFVSPLSCSDTGAVPDKPANAAPAEIALTGNPVFGVRFDYGPAGQAGALRFTAAPPAALVVQNFGFAVPGVPDFALAVCNAELRLPTSAGALPELASFDARLRVPLPDSPQGGSRRATLRVVGQSWGLDGRPPAGVIVALNEAATLFNETGCTVRLEPDPALTPSMGLELDVDPEGANQRTTVKLSGRVRLQLDPGILDDASTGQALGAALGGKVGLAVVTAPNGAVVRVDPIAELGTLEVAGRFHLGGASALLVRGPAGATDLATLRFTGLQNLLRVTSAAPFVVELTGVAEVPGLFAFTLNQARLSFVGPGGPLFGVNEAALSAPGGGNLLQLLQGDAANANLLPLTISKVGFGLIDGQRPVTGGAFAPDNLRFILSGGLRLNLPGFDQEGATPEGVPLPSIEGGVNDLAVAFPQGFAALPSVSANGLRLTLRNLKIGDLGGITGSLAVANLTDPANLLIAGEAGATFNDVGVKLLLAAGRNGLIGVCLSANAGPAGIPLDGGTLGGILLTGAEGGVKFGGGFADPCEFSSYLTFAGDGTPQYAPPVGGRPIANVNDAVALSWEELAVRQQLHDMARAAGFSAGLVKTEVTAARTVEVAAAAAPADPYACTPIVCPPTPAPDENNDAMTIKLQGTFSHAAVSTVLTLDGGVLASTDGTACATGALNLLGIPVGTANACFSLNPDGAGIPNPQVCGTAFLGIGPLELGSLNLLLSCPDCVSGVVAALGDFAIGATNVSGMRDFAFTAIDEARGFTVNGAGQLVPTSPVDRGRPLTDYLGAGAANGVRLSPKQQVAVVARILNVQQAVAHLPPSTAPAIVAQAKELLFRLNEAVAPQFTFCGSVGPKLFGFPLSGTDVIKAKAEFRRLQIPETTGPKFDQFSAQLRFSPSWFMLNQGLMAANLPPFIPGVDNADLGFSVQTPTVTRAELDLLFTLPAGPATFLEQRAQSVLEGSIATFGYELTPFGVRLGNGQARVLFPALASHPRNPARSPAWTSVRPPTVSNSTKLSRTDLLLLAAEKNLLRDALWRGRAGDLDDLVAGRTQLFNGQALPAGLATQLAGQELVRDYFPYGGVLAAGSVNFPNFLASAPPLDQLAAVFTPPADSAAFNTWWTAVSGVWTSYVTGTTEVGSAAMYLPAPNPPGLWTAGGNNAPSNLQLLDALKLPSLDAILDPANPQRTQLFAFDEILLQGYVAPRFFGLPVGQGRINLVDGRLEITAGADTATWLGKIVPAGTAPGAAFDLNFKLEQPRYLAAKRGVRPTTSAEATAPSAEQVFNQIAATITPANASAKTAELLDSLPRASLEADVALTVPSELQPFLGASGNGALRFYGFSFGFEPDYNPTADARYPLPAAAFDAANPDPYTTARRQGGAGLAGRLNFTAPGFALNDVAAALSLSLGQGDAVFPRVQSLFFASQVALPGGFKLENARVAFDSGAPVGGDIYRMSGQFSPIDFAPFLVIRPPTANLIQPIGANERLGGDLRVIRTAGGAATSLALRPALAYSPLLGLTGEIFGATNADDFTFSSVPGTAWTATLRLNGPLLVRDPATMTIDPANPLNVGGNVLFRVDLSGGGFAATAQGVGVDDITLRVTLPNGAKITAFPGQPTEATWTLGSKNVSCLFVRVKRDGTTGLLKLHQLYYDSGTVTMNLAEAVDANGVKQPLVQTQGRVEFGLEPGTLAAQFGATPASLALPTTAVDLVSSSNVVVSNPGTAPLVVDASVTANSTEFQVSPVRAVIVPGDAVKFTVTFAPNASGARTGTLTLTAPRENVVRTIALSGTATATATLHVAPSALAFGSVERGRFVDRSIVVTNPGLAPLTITGATTAAPFSVIGATSFTVPPRGQATLALRYRPTSAVTSNGTLTVTSSVGNATVTLSGTGTDRLWYLQRRGERTLNAVAFATNGTGTAGFAVGNAGEVLTTASAGDSWQALDTVAMATLYDVALAADNSVGWLVGDNAAYLRTGATGAWLPVPALKDSKAILPAAVWRAAARRASDGRLAVVGQNAAGTGIAGSSPATPFDTEWPVATGPAGNLFKPLRDVVEINGAFFAVGADLEQVESTNGITWTRSTFGFQQALPSTTDFLAVAHAVGTTTAGVTASWLIVGEQGLVLHRFDNEVAWTKLDFSSLTGTRTLRGVQINNTTATIVGDGGLILRLTLAATSAASPRATAVAEVSEATRDLNAVALVTGTTRLVAVGRGGEAHGRHASLPTAAIVTATTADPLVGPTGDDGLFFRTIELRNPTATARTYTLTAPTGLTLEATSVTLQPGEARNVLATYDATTATGASGSIDVKIGTTLVASLPVDITEQSGGWQKLTWPAKVGDDAPVFLVAPETTAWLGTAEAGYRSTNAGTSWTQAFDPGTATTQVGHFADADYGLVGLSGTSSLLFRNSTTASGVTRGFTQDILAMDSELVATRLQGLLLARTGATGFLARFVDSGTTLTYTNVSVPIVITSLVDVAQRGSVFYALATDGVFSRPTASATWTRNFTASVVMTDLFALDASNLWAVGAAGTVYTFNGTSWSKKATTGVDGDFVAVAFSTATNGWGIVARPDGRRVVCITTDGGTTWSDEFYWPESAGRLTHIAVFPGTTTPLVAGENRQLWRRTSATTRTPSYAIGSAQVDFGSQPIGGRATATVTIRNPGTSAYTITSADLADATSPFSFDFVSNLTVPAGGSLDLTLVYRPRTTGRHVDRLRLSTTAANGFIEVELLGQAERRPATLIVDSQPSGMQWRLGAAGALARGARVFEVVEQSPGANQVKVGDNLVVGTVASDTVATRTYLFREWPGTTDVLYSHPVTWNGGTVLARFERQLAAPPVHSVPATVSATACGSLVVPTGVGPGPWLRVSDAAVTLRGLDATERFRAEGALYLSLSEAYGALQTSAWAIHNPEGGELVAATASSWRFQLKTGRFEFETETPGVRVLSRPVAAATRFTLAAAIGATVGDASIEGTFTYVDDANLVPGVVQFAAGSGVQFRLQTSLTEVRPYLALDGTVRLLRTPVGSGGWLFESPYRFEAGNPATIQPTDTQVLVDAGLLKVVRDASSSFQITLDAPTGAVGLKAGGLRVDFLNSELVRTPTATIDTSGRLELTLQSDLPFGPVALVRQNATSSAKLVVDTRALGFSLSTPQCFVRPLLPVAYVDARGEPLWPDTGWLLPAQNIDLLQDFEWRIDDAAMSALRFGLWNFGAGDRDSYLVAERKDGVFGLRFRSYSDLFFGDLDLRLRARMTGALAGRAEGRVKAFDHELGRAKLDFSAARTSFQFTDTLSFLGFSATFDAGTSSATDVDGTFDARIR